MSSNFRGNRRYNRKQRDHLGLSITEMKYVSIPLSIAMTNLIYFLGDSTGLDFPFALLQRSQAIGIRSPIGILTVTEIC